MTEPCLLLLLYILEKLEKVPGGHGFGLPVPFGQKNPLGHNPCFGSADVDSFMQ